MSASARGRETRCLLLMIIVFVMFSNSRFESREEIELLLANSLLTFDGSSIWLKHPVNLIEGVCLRARRGESIDVYLSFLFSRRKIWPIINLHTWRRNSMKILEKKKFPLAFLILTHSKSRRDEMSIGRRWSRRRERWEKAKCASDCAYVFVRQHVLLIDRAQATTAYIHTHTRIEDDRSQ